MSSYEEPVDSQLVEQTRRQIQSLMAEIAQLSRQNLSPAQFYSEFLNRLLAALAAVGGVVWTTGDNGQLALQYQMNLQQTGLMEDEEKQKRHSRLLYKVLNNPSVAGGEGLLIPPHSGFGDDDAANDTEFLLVFGPLRTDLEMVGLVEVFQRADVAPAVQDGFLRFTLQMCELAGDFLKSHQLRHYSDRQVLWAKLEDFTRNVHASLEPKETAYTIANEARRLIECDRVSVALRKGGHCNIEAISGQDVFDKRSNTVRLLGRLATAVVATGEAVWYAGDTRDLAPQVEDAVQEYVDEAHSKMIAVLPLGRPKADQEADQQEKEGDEAPIGALIVEQIEDNRVAPAMAQRIDVVCRHSSLAMANAVEHQSLFLMPLWRAIGKSKVIIQARTLPKTILITAGVLITLLALIIVPADYDLQAKGTLKPIDRRDIFAKVDGQVYELGKDVEGRPLEHGSRVAKDQVLLRLRNYDLNAKKADIDGQVVAEEARRAAVQQELRVAIRTDERAKLQGDLAESSEKLRSLEAQAKIFEDKLAQLEVRSPISGIVMTWELENRLMGRPVQKGQSLLRVANPEGDWQLELHMADDRMGAIERAKKEAEEKAEIAVTPTANAASPAGGAKKSGSPTGGLPVYYILATEPGTKLTGHVTNITPGVDVMTDKEEGNVALIKVGIDKKDIAQENLRAGATVTGKVHCGRRSLGYVWFHDLLSFIQSKVIFRFF